MGRLDWSSKGAVFAMTVVVFGFTDPKKAFPIGL